MSTNDVTILGKKLLEMYQSGKKDFERTLRANTPLKIDAEIRGATIKLDLDPAADGPFGVSVAGDNNKLNLDGKDTPKKDVGFNLNDQAKGNEITVKNVGKDGKITVDAKDGSAENKVVIGEAGKPSGSPVFINNAGRQNGFTLYIDGPGSKLTDAGFGSVYNGTFGANAKGTEFTSTGTGAQVTLESKAVNDKDKPGVFKFNGESSNINFKSSGENHTVDIGGKNSRGFVELNKNDTLHATGEKQNLTVKTGNQSSGNKAVIEGAGTTTTLSVLGTGNTIESKTGANQVFTGDIGGEKQKLKFSAPGTTFSALNVRGSGQSFTSSGPGQKFLAGSFSVTGSSLKFNGVDTQFKDVSFSGSNYLDFHGNNQKLDGVKFALTNDPADKNKGGLKFSGSGSTVTNSTFSLVNSKMQASGSNLTFNSTFTGQGSLYGFTGPGLQISAVVGGDKNTYVFTGAGGKYDLDGAGSGNTYGFFGPNTTGKYTETGGPNTIVVGNEFTGEMTFENTKGDKFIFPSGSEKVGGDETTDRWRIGPADGNEGFANVPKESDVTVTQVNTPKPEAFEVFDIMAGM